MSNAIGQVVSINGSAKATDSVSGLERVLAIGSEVFQDEFVDVSQYSTLKIQLFNGTNLNIGPASALQLTEDVIGKTLDNQGLSFFRTSEETLDQTMNAVAKTPQVLSPEAQLQAEKLAAAEAAEKEAEAQARQIAQAEKKALEEAEYAAQMKKMREQQEEKEHQNLTQAEQDFLAQLQNNEFIEDFTDGSKAGPSSAGSGAGQDNSGSYVFSRLGSAGEVNSGFATSAIEQNIGDIARNGGAGEGVPQVVLPPVIAFLSVDRSEVSEGGPALIYTLSLQTETGEPYILPANGGMYVDIDWSGLANPENDVSGLQDRYLVPGGESFIQFFGFAIDDPFKEGDESLIASITGMQPVNSVFEDLRVGNGVADTVITDIGSVTPDVPEDITEVDTVYVVVSAPEPTLEGEFSKEFTVTVVDYLGQPVTLVQDAVATVVFSNDTAEIGDYDAVAQQVTLLAGTSSATFTVQTNEDDDYDNETFSAAVQTFADNGQFENVILDQAPEGLSNTAIAEITDNDWRPPTISIADITVNEDQSWATLTVTLDKISPDENISFIYTTAANTPESATPDEDYYSMDSQRTIYRGELTTTIDIPINDDYLLEGDETFLVNLTVVSGEVYLQESDLQAVVTIQDSGSTVAPPEEPELITAADTVYAIIYGPEYAYEAEVAGEYQVSLVDQWGTPVTVTESTDIVVEFGAPTDTAEAGDYSQLSQTINIPVGESTGTFVVPTYADLDYDNDTFTVAITNVQDTGEFENIEWTNLPIGLQSSMVTEIQDRDLQPAILVNDVTVNEDAGTMTFTVSVTSDTRGPITFDFATAQTGSATADADYGSVSGTGSIMGAMGFYSTTITVPIYDDFIKEGDETFVLNISNVSGDLDFENSVLQGVGTIIDLGSESPYPPNPPEQTTAVDTVYVRLVTNDVQTEGQTLTHTVELFTYDSLGNEIPAVVPMGETVTVDITYNQNYTDTADLSDYIGQISVMVGAGQSSALISNPTIDDVFAEGSQFYTATIQSVSLVNDMFEALVVDSANSSVTGTIEDNDIPIVSINTVDDRAVEGLANGNTVTFYVSQTIFATATNLVTVKPIAGDVEPSDFLEVSFMDADGFYQRLTTEAEITAFFENGIEVAIPLGSLNSGFITFTAFDDTIFESSESFQLAITAADIGEISQVAGVATGYIDDEDLFTPNDRLGDKPAAKIIALDAVAIEGEDNELSFQVTQDNLSEINNIITIRIDANEVSAADLSEIRYVDQNGQSQSVTTVSGIEAILQNGLTVMIPSLENSSSPIVFVAVDDEVYEKAETIELQITSATASNVDVNEKVSGTIYDEDLLVPGDREGDRPSVSIVALDDYAVEGQFLNDTLTFQVQLNGEADTGSYVSLQPILGDTSPEDFVEVRYVDFRGNLQIINTPNDIADLFDDGFDVMVSEQTNVSELITFKVADDVLFEPLETFSLEITDAMFAEINPNESVASATIESNDSPLLVSANEVHQMIPTTCPEDTSLSTNVVITLDISSSMRGDPIAEARNALTALLEQYKALATNPEDDVNVRIVLFDGTAELVISEQGTAWMEYQEALDFVANISTGRGTNYEAGLYETFTNYSEPSADQTVAFFISDGEPTAEIVDFPETPGYLDTAYQDGWTNFVEQYVDTLHVIAMGTDIDQTYLQMVADAGNTQVEVVDVDNVAGTFASYLSDTVQSDMSAVPMIVSGYLLDNIAGGQAPYTLESVEIDGQTYNILDFMNGGTVAIEGAGQLEVDFFSGNFTYTASSSEFDEQDFRSFTVNVSDDTGAQTDFEVEINIALADCETQTDGDTTPTDDNNGGITSSNTVNGDDVHTMNFISASSTNLVVILDVSRTMQDVIFTADGDIERIELVKDALIAAIQKYQEMGETNIYLTLFASNALTYDAMTAAEAIELIGNLSMDFAGDLYLDGFPIYGIDSTGTDYAAALNAVSDLNVSSPAADQTIGLFITDGDPNENEALIVDGSDVMNAWEDFVTNQLDQLQVIGVGSGIAGDYLDTLQVVEGQVPELAYDDIDFARIINSDATLSVRGTVMDNFSSAVTIQSIVVDGMTLTANDFPRSGGIPINGKGIFVFNFTTGEYSFTANESEFSEQESYSIAVNTVFSDGEAASMDIVLNITAPFNQIAADSTGDYTYNDSPDMTDPTDPTINDGYTDSTSDGDIAAIINRDGSTLVADLAASNVDEFYASQVMDTKSSQAFAVYDFTDELYVVSLYIEPFDSSLNGEFTLTIPSNITVAGIDILGNGTDNIGLLAQDGFVTVDQMNALLAAIEIGYTGTDGLSQPTLEANVTVSVSNAMNMSSTTGVSSWDVKPLIYGTVAPAPTVPTSPDDTIVADETTPDVVTTPAVAPAINNDLISTNNNSVNLTAGSIGSTMNTVQIVLSGVNDTLKIVGTDLSVTAFADIDFGAGYDELYFTDIAFNELSYSFNPADNSLTITNQDDIQISLINVERIWFKDNHYVEVSSGQIVDGTVTGLRYETSSGITGLTGEKGELTFMSGDEITFYIGDLLIGTAQAEQLEDGFLFLQEIANVDLTNLSDPYVQNMAVLLQSLDANANPEDGIVITPEMHEAFSGAQIDLTAISNDILVEQLEELDIQPVTVDEAMLHVKSELIANTELQESDFIEADSLEMIEPEMQSLPASSMTEMLVTGEVELPELSEILTSDIFLELEEQGFDLSSDVMVDQDSILEDSSENIVVYRDVIDLTANELSEIQQNVTQ